MHFKGGIRLDATQQTSMLEPGKKSRSVSAHLFLTRICCFSLSNWHGCINFNTLFLPMTTFDQVVNKPLGSKTEFLVFVHFYHGRVRTGSKFSRVPQWYSIPSLFWNLLLRHGSLFSRENSARYSLFLFDELSKQNLLFSSLSMWVFMSPLNTTKKIQQNDIYGKN